MKQLLAILQMPFVFGAVLLLTACGIIKPSELVQMLGELTMDALNRRLSARPRSDRRLENRLPPRLPPVTSGTQILEDRARVDAKDLGLRGRAQDDYVADARREYKQAVPRSATEAFDEAVPALEHAAWQAEMKADPLRVAIPIGGRPSAKPGQTQILWISTPADTHPERAGWEQDAKRYLSYRKFDTDIIREWGPIDPRIERALAKEGIEAVEQASKPVPREQLGVGEADLVVNSRLPKVDVNAKTAAPSKRVSPGVAISSKLDVVSPAQVLQLREELAAKAPHVDEKPTRPVSLEQLAEEEIAAMQPSSDVPDIGDVIAQEAAKLKTRLPAVVAESQAEVTNAGGTYTKETVRRNVAWAAYKVLYGGDPKGFESFLRHVPAVPDCPIAPWADLTPGYWVLVVPDPIEEVMQKAGVDYAVAAYRPQELEEGRTRTTMYWIYSQYGVIYRGRSPFALTKALKPTSEKHLFVIEGIWLAVEYPDTVPDGEMHSIDLLGVPGKAVTMCRKQGRLTIKPRHDDGSVVMGAATRAVTGKTDMFSVQ